MSEEIKPEEIQEEVLTITKGDMVFDENKDGDKVFVGLEEKVIVEDINDEFQVEPEA